MSVLIDPPLWPAHGTLFSHLVSDRSVQELHAFARAAGVHPKAFDRDHYDVPARDHQRLVAAGAVPVAAGELTRRLIDSPVRVPARDRPDRHAGWLHRRFDSVLPDRAETGQRLLQLWSAPGRYYHDQRHLADVLRGIDRLTEASGAPTPAERETRRVAELAGWWHDAVYDGVSGDDEHASALLARQMLLDAEPSGVLDRVQDAIEMTAHHRPGDDPAQGLLSDADLRVLARPEASYGRYVANVRQDYAHVSDEDFTHGRIQVLNQLLNTERLFSTDVGHSLWETKARQNLEAELRHLTA